MRAIVQTSVGGPEVLTLANRPDPVPNKGEVLVRVHAAGINPVDVAVRSGAYPLLGEPPFTVGWDISGVVEKVGPDTNGFAAGDEVFGMPRFPKEAAAYAELVAAPADELVLKPKGIDHAHAGALPLAGLTAWQALVGAGQIKPGQRVLVQAAAGGVGHLAVQIAKAFGAYVVATASPSKLGFVRDLGADEVVDYTKTRFSDVVSGIDVVLEPIGGENAEQAVKVLKDNGTLVSLLGISDKAKAEAKVRGIRHEHISVVPDREGLRELAKLIDAGKLAVHVARTFPLGQAGEAQAFLATKPTGKIALQM
ncbi:NADP-dependent oxidoreductase [Mesorhizobium sp. 1M-11]|uniref:NADP-dependent oxidoreductase n=1 Tax=Mesorhizobium sp. 1M-11 TaxID=1529006 RepID=UPI0006C7694E|nr:NADP-dependent oxidoreductase [Mesorhizobium sp. 1M-11]